MPQQKAREEALKQKQQQAQQQVVQQQQKTTRRPPAARRAPAAPPAGPQVPGGQSARRRPPRRKPAPRRWRHRRACRSRPTALAGSIALKGARIDDLSLTKFHETVNKNSPPIELLSPSGSPEPFYAQFGWTAASGSNVKVPSDATLWKQEGSGALTVGHPVTLTWDNGAGARPSAAPSRSTTSTCSPSRKTW